MDRSSRFWNLTANRYSRLPLADEAVYLEKLRLVREHLDTRVRVLEFGCGTGSTALLLSPHVRSYLALDFSSRMIEIARAKAEGEGMDNLEFQCRAFAEFEAPDASFDVVLGMSILHLLKDWQGALEKVYALLPPGGMFFSSTACIADMDTPARHLSRLGGLMGLLPVLSVFSQEQLTGQLTRTGFRVLQEWVPGEKKPVFVAAVKPE